MPNNEKSNDIWTNKIPENGDGERTTERPLPPLPQISCLVETPDVDSEVEEVSDNDSSQQTCR